MESSLEKMSGFVETSQDLTCEQYCLLVAFCIVVFYYNKRSHARSFHVLTHAVQIWEMQAVRKWSLIVLPRSSLNPTDHQFIVGTAAHHRRAPLGGGKDGSSSSSPTAGGTRWPPPGRRLWRRWRRAVIGSGGRRWQRRLWRRPLNSFTRPRLTEGRKGSVSEMGARPIFSVGPSLPKSSWTRARIVNACESSQCLHLLGVD